MLGKAKGLILHVAACLKMFFCDHLADQNDEENGEDMDVVQIDSLPTIIKEEVVEVAIDYVDVCCQHTLYITGRQLLQDEVKKYTEGTYVKIWLTNFWWRV